MANYNGRFKSLGFMVAAATAVFMAAIFAPHSAVAHDPDPGETTYPFEEMVVLTEYDILLEGVVIARNGNLCSRKGNIQIGPRKVIIPRRLTLTADVIAENRDADPAKGLITLIGGARVAHTRSNCDLAIPGCDGHVILDPANPADPPKQEDDAMVCPDDPPFPSFSASNDPADDIYCVIGGTPIIPGTYRDLIVETQGGKCLFQGPGDYNFRRIIAKKPGNFILENAPDPCDLSRPFNINVKEFMYLAEHSEFNRARVVPSFIHVEGTDGDYGGDNHAPDGLDGLGPSVFYYDGDGALCVCKVFAPNGTISIHGHLRPSCSQFVGRHFQQVSGLRIDLGLPFKPECCIQIPERQCPCILDFYEEGQPSDDKEVVSGGRICIEGKQLSEYNVDKVLFFEENNRSITDFLDCAGNADCEVLQADITFAANQEEMYLTVPCSAANYYLLIEDNDNFCGHKTDKLVVVP